ncbi:CPBP family intramembrane glutamic endopeptidase [Acetobacterium malicum]|uniref:CPBP family intramembrane glutamic endopeptidase n=1 Tax=Acetobacterium malicum TaxID=52692 RepID=UPI0035942101
MRNEALGDVAKVWLYAAASVLLGAWVSPLFYNAGKALAEVSAVKETNGPLVWLAGHCRTADFPEFFEVAIVVSAIALFLPFMEWLHGGRNTDGGKVGTLRLPEGARARSGGQRLRKNPRGLFHLATGFIGVTLLFSSLAAVLLLAGIFEWKNAGVSLRWIVPKVLMVSVILAVVQEILFRGIAMGIFLRAMRPAAALGVSAVLFALVHLLHPTPQVNVLDPEASGVGFELLRKIAAQFSESRVVLGTLAPMLALGGVLAYARWKTASLCLPIGLHAGWIFVNGLLASVTVTSGRQDSMLWVLAGTTLQQGLVPLFGILIAGGLAVRFTSSADAPETPA